ncbi:MAG: hypothetical protein ACM3XZ_07445 [Betaproteobacteria bacterium]
MKLIFATLASFVLIALVAFLATRPWYLRWGATEAEVSQPLPGDDLVPHPKMATTRAIVIHAPAADVWPWLVQVGYGRAGWYNYDWINRLMGGADFVDGHRSSTRIVPELQELKVGDTVKIAPQGGWTVMALEAERLLVFLARVDLKTGKPFSLTDPKPKRYLNSSQTIVLEPVDGRTTRLIVRDRMDFDMGGLTIVNWILEPGFFIQESAFMRGVKQRAERLVRFAGERRPGDPSPTPRG